jgi:hypothetical protein
MQEAEIAEPMTKSRDRLADGWDEAVAAGRDTTIQDALREAATA